MDRLAALSCRSRAMPSRRRGTKAARRLRFRPAGELRSAPVARRRQPNGSGLVRLPRDLPSPSRRPWSSVSSSCGRRCRTLRAGRPARQQVRRMLPSRRLPAAAGPRAPPRPSAASAIRAWRRRTRLQKPVYRSRFVPHARSGRESVRCGRPAPAESRAGSWAVPASLRRPLSTAAWLCSTSLVAVSSVTGRLRASSRSRSRPAAGRASRSSIR